MKKSILVIMTLLIISGMSITVLACGYQHHHNNHGHHYGNGNNNGGNGDNGCQNDCDDNTQEPTSDVQSNSQSFNNNGGGFFLFGNCDCQRVKILDQMLLNEEISQKRYDYMMDIIAWGGYKENHDWLVKYCIRNGYNMTLPEDYTTWSP